MDFQLDSHEEDDGISVQNQILQQQYKLLKSQLNQMDNSVKRALNIFTDSLDNLIIEGMIIDNDKQIIFPVDYNKEKLKDAIVNYEKSIRYLENQIKSMENLIRHKMSGKKEKSGNVVSYFKKKTLPEKKYFKNDDSFI